MNANAVHRLRSMLFPGGENGDYEDLLPIKNSFWWGEGDQGSMGERTFVEKVLLHCQKKLNRLLVS